MSALPACEKSLCAFVMWLANESLKHRTINVCLSAVCHTQVAVALPDSFSGVLMARLQHVLRGSKKGERGRANRVSSKYFIPACSHESIMGAFSRTTRY